MAAVRWNTLTDPAFELELADVSQPWLRVLDAFRNYTHLRIVADGTWSQLDGAIGTCTPDGLPGLALRSDWLTVADCPVGALIGKLGGSSASLSSPAASSAEKGGAGNDASGGLAEGKAFAIGSYCVAALPQNFIGPLFVSFNGLRWPVRVNTLRITVEGVVAS